MKHKKKKKLRILFAGGGSGGHIFPGISVAEEFQERCNCDIRFVGANKEIERKIILPKGYKLYTIPVSGIYRVGILKKIITLLKLPVAIVKSYFILSSFRPHLVIGLGGYVSGPLLSLAILLQKKTIIQEQNAFPGITNRLLGKLVPLAFVPFEGMHPLFNNPVVVGNPIRKAIREASKVDFQRDAGKTVITIIGGSQGSRVLNEAMIDLLPFLDSVSDKIEIIHQTGKLDFERVKSAYEKFPNIKSDVSTFIDNMADLYLKSNLIFCRAGSIINEIIAVGRASILVPIPHSSGNHQLENAKKMEQYHASVLLEQKDLSKEKLESTIKDLLENPEKIEAMEKNARSLYLGESASMIVEKTIEYFKFQKFLDGK